DAAVNYWLARTYYEQHNYDKAVAYAEDAVKLAPQNPEYQRWLGRVYGAKAEESRSFFLARKVKQAFEAAVRLAPRSIEARRDLMQYLAEAPDCRRRQKQSERTSPGHFPNRSDGRSFSPSGVFVHTEEME